MAGAGRIIYRREIWKERLDTEEVWLIEKTCKKEMVLLDYKFEASDLTTIRKIKILGFYVMYLTNNSVASLRSLVSKILPRGIKDLVKEFIKP